VDTLAEVRFGMGNSSRTSRRSEHIDVRTLHLASRALGNLHLPASFTINDLQSKIEETTGRQIRLMPRAMPPSGLHGVWIAGTEHDYVFYERRTASVHRDAILAHEYWHILNNDSSDIDDLRHFVARLLPDIDPSMINKIAARTVYRKVSEQLAETFATLVMADLGSWSRSNPRVSNPTVQRHITTVLGSRVDD